jgi:hypothetical protein
MNSKNQIRYVEAEAFRDGTQAIDNTSALDEIRARFAQAQERVKLAAADIIKSLEARVDSLTRLIADTEPRWAALDALTDGLPPGFALPLCAVLVSILMVVGEAALLAPVMDGLNVADPDLQIIVAAVIVMAASALFEIAKKQIQAFLDGPQSMPANSGNGGSVSSPTVSEDLLAQVKPLLTRGLLTRSKPGALKTALAVFFTALAFALITSFGWWRAEEMISASQSTGGALESFISANPTLTRVVITLLSLALPIAVALAFEWGLDYLRLAREWRKARRIMIEAPQRLAETRKNLEAENEKLIARVAEIEKQKDEWTSAYLQSYALGRRIGAWRLPLWQIVVKIIAVMLLIFVALLLLDPAPDSSSSVARGLLCTFATLGAGGLYAFYAIKRWDRPSTLQLYKQMKTVWRNEMKDEQPPVDETALPVTETAVKPNGGIAQKSGPAN